MITPQAARELGFSAYQYFYPLVTMDVTRRQATNVPNPDAVPYRAPANQFAHYRDFPAGESKEVVRFNFDTLYSFVWLDLQAEPIVLTVPDSGGRYYLTPMLDMWSDVFAVPGTRTTGGTERHFAIAAPGWSGDLPDGVELIQAPTPMAWVMGRTQVNGRADLPRVNTIQNGLATIPLSKWGTDFAWPTDVATDPSVDDETAPLHQVNALGGLALISRGAELLGLHPPHAADHPMLVQLEAIGLTHGEAFTASELPADVREAFIAGADAALEDIIGSTIDGSLGAWRNGWMTVQGGTYATDYRRRAMVALGGLGCNLPEDALYPGTAVDSDGESLSGDRAYVLRFEANEIPQTNAFWSLTMYDVEGFQVPNALDRYALGDRDELTYGADGSLELYLQQSSPGAERGSNWLPTPAGLFQPMLRMYSPTPETLRRGVSIPSIRKAG